MRNYVFSVNFNTWAYSASYIPGSGFANQSVYTPNSINTLLSLDQTFINMVKGFEDYAIRSFTVEYTPATTGGTDDFDHALFAMAMDVRGNANSSTNANYNIINMPKNKYCKFGPLNRRYRMSFDVYKACKKLNQPFWLKGGTYYTSSFYNSELGWIAWAGFKDQPGPTPALDDPSFGFLRLSATLYFKNRIGFPES